MKKNLARLAAVLMTALVFTTVQAQDLLLTGWPYEPDVVNSNLERFAEQSGITAEFSPFPSDAYRDRMITSFIGGTEFDVVYVRDGFLPEWASAGWLQPIDGMPGLDAYLEDMPQAVIDQMSFDGELYGLPYYSGMNVFAYNAAHLAEAGIDAPPQTWDELLEQAQIISDAGISDSPIMLQLQAAQYITNTLEIVVAGHGGTLFDAAYEPVFADEGSATREAINWIQEGLDAGLIDQASLAAGDSEAVRALSAGTHTFTLVADYNVKTMNDPEQSQVAGDVTIGLIPGDGSVDSGTTSYIRLYGLTADAEDPMAAWRLMEFLGGADATGEYYVPNRWALEFGLGFAYTSMYSNDDIRASLSEWTDPDVLAEQAGYSVNRNYRFVPFFAEWETDAWGNLQNLMTGSGNTDRTYNQLESNWNDLKSEYGY